MHAYTLNNPVYNVHAHNVSEYFMHKNIHIIHVYIHTHKMYLHVYFKNIHTNTGAFIKLSIHMSEQKLYIYIQMHATLQLYSIQLYTCIKIEFSTL